MRRLNYQVEGELRDIKEVVREFLQSKGFWHSPTLKVRRFMVQRVHARSSFEAVS
jgi:hypothetical protein